jgi:hypothetical protein
MVDPEMELIPLRQFFGIVAPKEESPDAEYALSGRIRLHRGSVGRRTLGSSDCSKTCRTEHHCSTVDHHVGYLPWQSLNH